MCKSKCLFCVILLALVLSCKPQVPGDYIQPDELEDILYDYHLADAMAEENRSDDNMQYNRLLYRQAVLKKYGITQAEFDSTLVYYTRHSDRLHRIYENLSKRFSDEAMALGASASDVNRYGNLTSDGDTANVWTGDKAVILTADAPYNVMSFEITADTTYHKGDRMMLNFNTDFIFRDGMRDAVASLAIQFANDSVAGSTTHMSSNSKYTVSVSDNGRLGIKAVRGFIYLPKSRTDGPVSLQLLSVTNISLVRFHDNEKPMTVSPDSLKVHKPDSLRRVGNVSRPVSANGIERMELPADRKLPVPATR